MVRTGARAAVLADLLEQGGLTSSSRPPAPRPTDLDAASAERVVGTYRELGGAYEQPTLRPGAWDLCAGGTVVELDEELHFNRYRAATLEGEWAAALPWCDDYRELCGVREPECLRAATWGKRWANPSSDRLFGGSSPPGDLDGGLGASRWKQRALYDAFKDVVALTTDLRLARLSVWDDVGGRRLGEVLEGRAEVDPADVVALVVRRAV